MSRDRDHTIHEIVNLRMNIKAREWCLLPYPDHPKGCPNYDDKNHRNVCPPSAPLFYDFVDTTKPLYLLAVGFNLGKHINTMLLKHPNWSNRQARCVLYWQGSVNKELRQFCQQFAKIFPDYITTTCPEAMGVNVIATAQDCGLPIKTKPTDYVYKIAIAGAPK